MSRNVVRQFLAALALVAFFATFGAVRPALAWACNRPLEALDPTSLGLDPTQATQQVAVPIEIGALHDSFVIHFPTSSAPITTVGVVVPAPAAETYTVSPVASANFDENYDISGCWNAQGAVVQAQPGHYTFIAVAADNAVYTATLAVRENPGLNPACGVGNEVFALAAAKQYAPLAPTVAGKVSGLMMGGIAGVPRNGDGYITASALNLKAQAIDFELVNSAKAMAANIAAVYKNNKNAPIVAGEIGHGTPNCWANVNNKGVAASFGTDGKGKPSTDLMTIEVANVGQVSMFDIFSCDVALGSVDKKGMPNAKHTLTQMATALVGPNNGDAVTVRAVNVVIAAFPPSRLHKNGVWLISTVTKEAVDKKPAGTQVEMTCTNNNGTVGCAAVRTQLYP